MNAIQEESPVFSTLERLVNTPTPSSKGRDISEDYFNLGEYGVFFRVETKIGTDFCRGIVADDDTAIGNIRVVIANMYKSMTQLSTHVTDYGNFFDHQTGNTYFVPEDKGAIYQVVD
ncbi:MAG: hypothetical protein AABX51_01700 [Nanoarchaeota archaeon]